MEIPENGAMTAMRSAAISTIGAVMMNGVPSAAVNSLAVTAKVWSVPQENNHCGNMRNRLPVKHIPTISAATKNGGR